MLTLRFSRVFLVMAFCLSACTSTSKAPKAEMPVTQNPPVLETASDSAPVNWKDLLGPTSVPAGWSATPCGDLTLLCVRVKDKKVGTVELSTRALERVPDFQQMLEKEGISTANTDSHAPKNVDRVLSVLKTWIVDHYEIIEQDLQGRKGDRVIFSTRDPKELPFGSHRGLRYEFSTKDKNSLQERSIGYLAVFDNTLYVVQTTVEPGITLASDLATFNNEKDFKVFEPHLEKIVANLKLADRS